MSDTGWCLLCPGPIAGADILIHAQHHHPDRYEPPPEWPDGSLVVAIADDTLTPTYFEEAG